MNQEAMVFGMRNMNNPSVTPVLQSVQADGRLDGLLFALSVRQVYHNASPELLEVVYTFPLAMGAVLLGLDVEMGGKTLSGLVVEKQQAHARYEEAMEAGDAPIMLERTGDGMVTVNLGNIKPGEKVVVTYRYAQLLSFEQDQVRLCIPTTIAPRYGDPVAEGKLQPHQVPQASLTAEYGLALTVALEGRWAQAEIACVTHAHSTQAGATGSVLRLGQRAWLDRDVVITLKGPAVASVALAMPDQDQQVVLASFQPALAPALASRLDLKLLVDCSGSMAGDSIASAKAALACVANQLGANDRFSFSRFGSTVVHGFRRLAPARASNLAMLHALIATTDANLGGTEMEAALSATIGLAGTAERADILLITDGEIWNVEPMIAVAAASKHRLFIVGVGAAPAESLLRRLAEATGGACEFATPGENLRAAIDRMFARIRQLPRGAVRLAWSNAAGPVEPAWVAGVPHTVFGGDTVHVFAGFALALPGQARLLLDAPNGEQEIAASADIVTAAPSDDALVRMAAATRLHGASEPDALALALRYQLVTSQTNCIVVHVRAEADKALDLAQLHVVPSMLAAGWGGSSEMTRGAPQMRSAAGGAQPAMFRSMSSPAPVQAAAKRSKSLFSRLADFKLDRSQSDQAAMAMGNGELLATALAQLTRDGAVKLVDVLGGLNVEPAVSDCINALAGLGIGREMAWALVVRWLAELDAAALAGDIEQALEVRLTQLTAEQWKASMPVLMQFLPGT